MKRPLALMFALALLAAFAAHTAHAATNVHFGVLAGAGFAKMRMDNDAASNLGNFTAPAIGVTARIEIAPQLSIEPQLIYVSDGFSWGEATATDEVGNSQGTFEQLSVLEHVQTPVLFRYLLTSEGKVRIFGVAGPYGSIRTREYRRMTGALEHVTKTDDLRTTHFGVVMGGGIQMPAGPGELELQLRYDTALTSVQSFDGLGNVYPAAVRVLVGWSH